MKQHPAQPPSSPAAQVRRKRSRFSKHTIASRPAPHRLLVAQPSNSAAPEQGVHQRWLHPALSQCLVHIARLLAALGWLLGRLGLAHGSMGQCSIWAAAITAGTAWPGCSLALWSPLRLLRGRRLLLHCRRCCSGRLLLLPPLLQRLLSLLCMLTLLLSAVPAQLATVAVAVQVAGWADAHAAAVLAQRAAGQAPAVWAQGAFRNEQGRRRLGLLLCARSRCGVSCLQVQQQP